MKQRPGDQQLPEQNGLPFVQQQVIADIEERIKVGIERYGTPLQPFNGRDTLRDAYEEALDLAVYLRSMISAQEVHAEGVAQLITKQIVQSGRARDFGLALSEVDNVVREVFRILSESTFPERE